MLTKGMEKVIPILQSVSNRAAENPEIARNILLVVAWLAGLVTVVGLIWMAIPAIVTWFSAIWTVIWAVSRPITLIVVALWLLYLAWKNNFMWIREKTDEFVNRFTTNFWPTLLGVWEEVKIWREQMKVWFTVLFTLLWAYTQEFLNAVQKFWMVRWDTIKLYLTSLWNVMKAIFSWALEQIKLAFKFWINVFNGDRKAAWWNVKDMFKNVIDTISNIFQALQPALSAVWTWIKNIVSSAIGAIVAKIQAMIDTVKWALDYATGIANKIWWMVSSASNATKTMANNLASATSAKASAVRQGTKDLFKASGWSVVWWQPYVVGEEWPEVFVPRSGGTIIPNDKAWKSVSINFGGVTISNWMDLDNFVWRIKQVIRDETRVAKLGVYV